MGIKTGLDPCKVLGQYVTLDVGLDPIRPYSEVTRKLICKLCGFVVGRHEVRGIGGAKYWGMKSKMVGHFHKIHPEIWAKLERN